MSNCKQPILVFKKEQDFPSKLRDYKE